MVHVVHNRATQVAYTNQKTASSTLLIVGDMKQG